ncbi:MAG: RsmE family RNA methyltransferase [Opitutales bacterium]|nr:RsmE family RNA methyltransferase [Opitutales bacterium]
MNALIFKDFNESRFLPFSHPKAKHIRDVLKLKSGDEIFAGVMNQNLYKTKICETPDGYEFGPNTTPLENPKQLDITLCCAFTRPQIAKRIMFEAACFGAKNLVFYAAQKGERDYLKASLYGAEEAQEQFINGAQQACSSFVPNLFLAENLQEALKCAEGAQTKIAPDLYESTQNISKIDAKKTPICAVFGGERGFSNADRDLLRKNNFTLVSLGGRVLRTDSAIIAALAILANAM